jgi:two-component system, NtrC family, response regulator AtoC
MADAPKILVVDDETLIRDMLKEVLKRMGLDVDEAPNGTTAINKLKEDRYDLIISDIRMPDVSGMEVLKAAHEHVPDTEVIMLTAYGTIENAVEAMDHGAFNYITKDYTPDHIEQVVSKALEHYRLRNENRRLRQAVNGQYGFDQIVGKSSKMMRIFETLESVADSDATVFIQGPSGTGKELIAKALHYNSRRRDNAFIKTNCAALPEGLMESELFGHEKGAFTGAIKSRIGRFEAANEGTILLDEVSEMTPALQAKLLRVLQEREFERVGDTTPIKVDIRVIATTNRKIKEAIEEGQFREDLYYRLNVVPIYVPPLRERKKDIPLLIDHFISRFNKEHHREIEGISRESENLLMRLDWPGNVRELENRIERAVIMCKESILQVHNFLFEEEGFDSPVTDDADDDTVKTLRDVEKDQILKTLRSNSNNRTKTAEQLDISVRTLRNKLNEYKDKSELDPWFLKGE